MKIIVGLGNPGEKYEKNRHNAGFVMIDEFRKELSKADDFSEFILAKKFNAEISEGFIDEGNKIIFVKPQTFMNKSGDAVQNIMSFHKANISDLIIIHDDLDIEIGNYKVSENSSAAGHNGVQDIFDKLGTQKIKRIRIGVETEGGRENRKAPGSLSSETLVKGERFVLQDFTDDEYKKVKANIQEIAKEIVQF